MDAVLIMVVSFVGYILAYKFYGKFLGQKIFKLSKSNKTPAVEMEDGMDYVPTKKGIIFGHHFTSIAGTGPIVGPAIGVIWGWVPALIWIFVGSIVMGAVQDFSALVLSLRNQGKSISEVASKYIGKNVRFVFFVVVFLELWLFLAILGMIIAIIFDMYPQAVFPVWMEIPIAVLLGRAIYKRGYSVVVSTIIAVVAMYTTVVLGHIIPITMPTILGIPPTGSWTIILFIYAFIASTLPVTTLLQPRDFINAWELFIAMGVLILGIFFSAFNGNLQVVAPAVQLLPEGAPSMWPFLFITIACGAISGFHSIVASGTSAKQVAQEDDALFVGYGSMLMEGALAVLVLIACTAGIGMAAKGDSTAIVGLESWTNHYASWSSAAGLGSKVGAFVEGSANMISFMGIPKYLGVIIMGVFVASFAGTSLDTTARLQRYVVQELSEDLNPNKQKKSVLSNKYAATLFALITAAILAFSSGIDGKGALTLWPLFGAINQTLAGLALLTASVYLKRSGGLKYLTTLLPSIFIVIMTFWALIQNEMSYISGGKIMLGIINIVIILIDVFITFEAVKALLSTDKSTTSEAMA